jgi:hypothetical protein
MVNKNNPTAPVFALGEPYPASAPYKDGASARFLRRNEVNILGIVTRLGPTEEHILKFGCVEFGLVYENGALLLLLRFFSRLYRSLELCFSTPFDVRAIPRRDLELPRLVDEGVSVTIHIVNSKDRTLKVIRTMRLGIGQSLDFFSAIQDQLCEMRGGEDVLAGWLCRDTTSLIAEADMNVMEIAGS